MYMYICVCILNKNMRKYDHMNEKSDSHTNL